MIIKLIWEKFNNPEFMTASPLAQTAERQNSYKTLLPTVWNAPVWEARLPAYREFHSVETDFREARAFSINASLV
ncbi:MAG: hypothetical protein WC071_13570 [Victivallaceae bacterium]